MGRPFLMPNEMALMKRDFNQMVDRPDGTKVTLRYTTYVVPGDEPDIDPVYKNDRRVQNTMPVEVEEVPCFQRIVHDRDLKILAFGILEVGDVIFYFKADVNLQEPESGSPAVPGSLVIVDSLENEWVPVVNLAGPLRRHLAMLIQDNAIAEVIPAKLRA